MNLEKIVEPKTIITQDGDFILNEGLSMLIEKIMFGDKFFGWNLMGYLFNDIENPIILGTFMEEQIARKVRNEIWESTSLYSIPDDEGL
jgi:hypothetical protein